MSQATATKEQKLEQAKKNKERVEAGVVRGA